MSFIRRTTTLAAAAMISALALVGCTAIGLGPGDSQPDPDAYADVLLIDPFTDADITVRATRSGSSLVREAIKHMQNEDFDKAIRLLEEAVAEKETDHRAWYALGVCCERIGDFERAVEAYKTANIQHSSAEYQEARVRAEGWL